VGSFSLKCKFLLFLLKKARGRPNLSLVALVHFLYHYRVRLLAGAGESHADAAGCDAHIFGDLIACFLKEVTRLQKEASPLVQFWPDVGKQRQIIHPDELVIERVTLAVGIGDIAVIHEGEGHAFLFPREVGIGTIPARGVDISDALFFLHAPKHLHFVDQIQSDRLKNIVRGPGIVYDTHDVPIHEFSVLFIQVGHEVTFVD